MAVPVISATASASVTRPADTVAYASGDLLANSTTAGSVVPLSIPAGRGNGLSVRIRRVRIAKTGTSITSASFRVHLFAASPTVANGDNGVFSTNNAATYLGSVDVTVGQAFTDGAFGATTTEINFAPASNGHTVYGLIEVRAAYTPVSAEVFTVTLEADQN